MEPTSRPWAIIEPCCGSGAVTLRLLGITRPPCTWQGSKARFSEIILRLARARGFEGSPEEIWLSDVGPWGEVLPNLLNPSFRASVVAQLEVMAASDPKAIYDALHKNKIPDGPMKRAAEFLFLQRLSHSGKAVSWKGGRWTSPGFNVTSAYGVAGSKTFGEVKPQVPSMIRALSAWPDTSKLHVVGDTETLFPSSCEPLPKRLVYLDPPYIGTTPYPDGDMDREGVVDLALDWHESGAVVLVSEAEPIEELCDLGWTSSKIGEARGVTNPFHSKKAEYVTISPEIED